MSHFRCFQTPQQPLNSSEQTSQRKSKMLYNATRNMAEDGLIKKKTGGYYTGPVYINYDTGCLVHTDSHELLLEVTKGKYLCKNPCDASLNTQNWNGGQFYGNIMVTDFSGQVVTDTSANAGNTNQFVYPQPSIGDSNYPGIVVDPSSQLFYDRCKGQLGYHKNITIDNSTTTKEQLYKKIQQKKQLYGFHYPTKFAFNK